MKRIYTDEEGKVFAVVGSALIRPSVVEPQTWALAGVCGSGFFESRGLEAAGTVAVMVEEGRLATAGTDTKL